MNVLFKIGIIFGIMIVYTFVTWGVGKIINNNKYDDAGEAIGAWLTGFVLFIWLSIVMLIEGKIF